MRHVQTIKNGASVRMNDGRYAVLADSVRGKTRTVYLRVGSHVWRYATVQERDIRQVLDKDTREWAAVDHSSINRKRPPINCPPDGLERLHALEQKSQRDYGERVELALLRGHCHASRSQS